MKTLDEIQTQLFSGKFNFSRHAFKRAVERNISELELREAGKNAKIIEHYLDDKYTPSRLLLGFTKTNRPLHMQVSLTDTDFVKIITLYEPSESEWVDFTRRR